MKCRVCGANIKGDKWHGHICKTCHNSDQRERRARRIHKKDVYRWQNLKAKFAMTIDDYQTRWDTQNGVCAICGQPETETRRGVVKFLAVDHNHDTGEIRGLLCGYCNKMLGQARDNPDLLRLGAEYLERTG